MSSAPGGSRPPERPASRVPLRRARPFALQLSDDLPRIICYRRCRCMRGANGFDSSDFEEQFRSEEHTSELQSLMRISYAVFCLKKKKNAQPNINTIK